MLARRFRKIDGFSFNHQIGHLHLPGRSYNCNLIPMKLRFFKGNELHIFF